MTSYNSSQFSKGACPNKMYLNIDKSDKKNDTH